MALPNDKKILESLDLKKLMSDDTVLRQDNTFFNFLKPTRIVFDKKTLLEILTGEEITLHTENGIKVKLKNKLPVEERIRLANDYMMYITDIVGDMYEVPMTRKELIETLQAFDEIDPEGKLEVTFGDAENDFEATEVILKEKGEDKYIKIMG